MEKCFLKIKILLSRVRNLGYALTISRNGRSEILARINLDLCVGEDNLFYQESPTSYVPFAILNVSRYNFVRRT